MTPEEHAARVIEKATTSFGVMCGTALKRMIAEEIQNAIAAERERCNKEINGAQTEHQETTPAPTPTKERPSVGR